MNGKLCTPSNRNVLDGITKDVLFELAAKRKIDVMEGNFPPYNAGEAFLASTSPTIFQCKVSTACGRRRIAGIDNQAFDQSLKR